MGPPWEVLFFNGELAQLSVVTTDLGADGFDGSYGEPVPRFTVLDALPTGGFDTGGPPWMVPAPVLLTIASHIDGHTAYFSAEDPVCDMSVDYCYRRHSTRFFSFSYVANERPR